jgi:hypothetical protein
MLKVAICKGEQKTSDIECHSGYENARSECINNASSAQLFVPNPFASLQTLCPAASFSQCVHEICLMFLSFECFSVLIGMLIFSSLARCIHLFRCQFRLLFTCIHMDTIPQNACLLSKQIYRHLLICSLSPLLLHR